MKYLVRNYAVDTEDNFNDNLHDDCTDVYMRRKKNESTLEAMVKPLIEEVNAGSPQDLADAIVAALVSNHRTLQQAFLGAVKLALHKYAALDKGMYTDLRNESANEWAQAVDKIPNSDLRFPLI